MDRILINKIRKIFQQIRLPITIHGVVAFGSRVRDIYTDESDLDLLVVASGIHPRRQQRDKDILRIKKQLPAFPIDILLMTPNEVMSNFRNHNPLFLDIATEGIILLDREGFLKNLIEETRRYIKKNKIRKIKDGWVFPVKIGKLTYLSGVSNKDFAFAMLEDGKRDLEVGKKLSDSEFYDKAVYHFQQAIEKFVKAILITMGIFRKTHFIGEVLRNLIDEKKVPENWYTELIEIADISESIEPEVSLSRYPGIIEDHLWLPYEEYKKEDAEAAQRKAEKVFVSSQNFLNDWFSDKT